MKIGRRRALIGATAVAAAGLGGKLLWDRNERGMRAAAFIARADRYEGALLVDAIARGLRELGVGAAWAKDKSILLKPNLVEPAQSAPQINTHPAVVRAAAEVFASLGARRVIVAEGQGHVRDSYLVLEQSGLGAMIDEAKLEFIDLNHDDVVTVPNASNRTRLRELALPKTLRAVDRVVSIAKMKTHHWAGVTLTMKNLFGVMPGIVYGWPKNVLHQEGIFHSIVDIAATVQPDLAIVDGVIGMEGDGPIMGTAKAANVIVMGTSLPAVDATAARLMDFEPEYIPYLALASGVLGPVRSQNIEQRGEAIAALEQTFAILNEPEIRRFRDG